MRWAARGSGVGAPRLAAQALGATLRDPLTVLALFAVHLGSLAVLWLGVSQAFGEALTDRPTPDLFEMLALAGSQPHSLGVLAAAGVAGLAAYYLLGGPLIAALLLRRLQGDPKLERRPGACTPSRPPLARLLLRLLLLRLIASGAVAAVAVAGSLSLPQIFENLLAISDERLQAVLLVGAALPLAVCLLFAWLVLQLGQPLLVEGLGLGGALKAALALLQRRPLGSSALFLGGWLVWLGLTAASAATSLPPPLLALLRVAVHVWICAAALRMTRVWLPARGSWPD